MRAAFHDEVEALKRKLSEQNEHGGTDQGFDRQRPDRVR